MASAEHFDRPIIFLFVVAVGVAAMWSIISWGLIKLNWSGPLGLFKGGVMHGPTTAP